MSEPEPIKSIIERVLKLIGGDMSGKLCEKCQELWDDKSPKFFHCHHETPEEKPKKKCWCEYPSTQRYGIMKANNEYAPKASVIHWGFSFCGACGRRLWGI